MLHVQTSVAQLAEATQAWVKRHLIPLAVCMAWAGLNEALLRGRAFVPWDSASEFYPTAHFIVQSIRAGHAPWWNPLIFGGQPLFGDPQSLLFTPQVLVGVLAGARFNQHVFDLTLVFMELCGGLALARFARVHADTRLLPVLGAIVFMAGGVATSRLQHVPQIISYSLLPMQLLAMRGVCNRPSLWRMLVLAGVLCAGLANPNQVTYLSVFALAPFALLLVWESGQWRRSVAAVFVACIFAFFVCAPIFSAVREFVGISTRSSLGLAQSHAASMPLFNAASIFMPGLYGASRPEGGLWPPTDSTQDYLYIGVIPCLLLASVLAGALAASLRVWLCLASAGFWFVFAMGLHTPVYPWLFDHLPGLAAFRRPADGAYFLNLFLALGIAMLRVRRAVPRAPRALRIAAGIVLGCALLLVSAEVAEYAVGRGHVGSLLRVWLNLAWRAALLLGLGYVVLRARGGRFAWLAPPLAVMFTIADVWLAGRASGYFCQPERTSELAQVFSKSDLAAAPSNPLGLSVKFMHQQGMDRAESGFRIEVLGGDLGGDQPLAFGMMLTQGYDPIRLRAYDDIIGGQDLQNSAKAFTAHAPDYDSEYYRRLGLRYIAMHERIVAVPSAFGAVGASVSRIRAELLGSSWAKRLNAPGEYEIWELANAMPPATLVMQDGTQVACGFESFAASEVVVSCQAPAPGRLVLGGNFAPGWRACVNGQKADVTAFEALFRSVPVPAGATRTVFRYYPVPFLRFLARCH